MKQLTLTRYVAAGTLMLLTLAAVALTRIGGAQAEDGSVAPVISNIMASSSQTGATITWNTDQAANSQVYYGTTESYNASSTLITATSTSHTAFLGGLTASTTYHFQIRSANASGTLATSTDQTFTTLASTTATPTPTISSIVATPTVSGATITWNTDIATSSQVKYGTTTSYGSQSTLDSTPVMSHSVALSALAASTTYHFQVLSGIATSSDRTFTTLASTSTSTTSPTSTPPTSVDIQNLIDKLNALKEQLSSINSQLMNALSILAGFGSGTSTPPTPDTGGATISPTNQTVSAGSSLDFNGRNFGHEETVKILRGGSQVGTAHADGGGNFSTGSMNIPGPAGTYTYQFVGQSSGRSASATITVQ